MKGLVWILSVVCALLLVALFWSRSSFSSENERLLSESTKSSNDWQQAVLRLDEQSRLAFTLQTQLKITRDEHLVSTQQLGEIQGQVTLLSSNLWALQEVARVTSNRLQLRVLELEDEHADFRQRLTNSSTQAQFAQLRSSNALQQVTHLLSQATYFSNEMVRIAAGREQVEAELKDSVFLRDRLHRLEANSKSKTAGEEGKNNSGPVELLPDGSVRPRR